MHPLVSIVVPVYNVEAYIKKCLDSIVQQTYENIEIIIVIDGSTDGSEKIVRTYRDERILIINQVNQGLGAARNTGINHAKGDWLLFVDSDDWLNRNTVEKLIDAASEDKSDIVIFNLCYIYENDEIRRRTPKIRERVCIDGEEALRRELIGTEYRFHAPNKFCKTNLYRTNNIAFPSNKMYEDIATTYKLLAKASRVTLLSEDLYFYLQKRTGSITYSLASKRMFYDLFEAIDNVIDYVNALSCNAAFQTATQAFFVDNVISYVNYIYCKDRKTRKYFYNLLKKDTNWHNMQSLLKNPHLSLEKKIRGIMIRDFWDIYAAVMKVLRK